MNRIDALENKRKLRCRLSVLIVSLCIIILGLTADVGLALFKGEEVHKGGGYPALIKFIKGDPNKALIVFIPGAHHSARIAYGGHQGARSEDFLAYWLTAQGYNFLGISYPIEMKVPVIQGTYPDFTVRAWGRQAAEIANEIIDKNGLTDRIIVLGWSMGGKIVQAVNEAAVAQGLNLDFYVSVTATPPVTGAISMTKTIDMAASGNADRTKDFSRWYSQVKANSVDNQGRMIIPEDIYMNHYVGQIAVNLQGYGLRYRGGKFERDHWSDVEDFKSYAYADFPLVAMLIPNTVGDYRHALTDQGAWGLFIVNKIYHGYIRKNKVDVKKLPAERWRGLVDTVREAPRNLTEEVTGNHFFFVGETGARETARSIKILEDKVHALKAELSMLLGIQIK